MMRMVTHVRGVVLLAFGFLCCLPLANAQRGGGFRAPPERPIERPGAERPEGLRDPFNLHPGTDLLTGLRLERLKQITDIGMKLQTNEPDVLAIRRSLEDLTVSRTSAGTSLRPLDGADLRALSGYIRGEPSELETIPYETSTPNLLIRVPRAPAQRAIADFVLRHWPQRAIEKKIDRASVRLLAFPVSQAGRAALADIPSALRADLGLLRDVSKGRFDSLDTNMFSEFRGQTLVVVGHVVETKAGSAFEVRGEQTKHIPLSSLQEAAKEVGFNFIPLGCETAETAAVGTATKITDVDGLAAFKRAGLRDGVTTYKDLLADLSGPDLQIIIDVPRASALDVVPIEIQDQAGNLYRPAINTSGGPPATPPPIAGSLEMTVEHHGWLRFPCPISSDVLNWSIKLSNAAKTASRIWPIVIFGWIALFVVVLANEYAANAVRFGVSEAVKAPWVASFIAATHAPVRPTYYVVDAGAMALVFGMFGAGYGYLTAQMSRQFWEFTRTSSNYGPILFGLLPAAVVVIDQLSPGFGGRRWSIFAKGCLIFLILFLITSQSVIAAFFLTALLIGLGVGVPFFTFRLACVIDCNVAGWIALCFIPIFFCPLLLGGAWGIAQENCWLIEPRPLRTNFEVFEEIRRSWWPF